MVHLNVIVKNKIKGIRNKNLIPFFDLYVTKKDHSEEWSNLL